MGRLVALLVSLVLVGCGARLWPSEGPSGGDEHLRRAAEALHDGEFERAGEALRPLASQCENGEAGREAVLLLASLEMDPRNAAGSPQSAAQLAARYLQLPSASSSSRALAGALYLAALDRGAAPVADVLASIPSRPARRSVAASPFGQRDSWRVADRFQDCETGGGAIPLRRLPEHPGTPQWKMLESVSAELDSLKRHRASLRERVDGLAREAERVPELRQRIDSLEQELDRIRDLLPKGSSDGPPPPTR